MTMEPMVWLAGLAAAVVLAVAIWLMLRSRSKAGASAFAGSSERDFESRVAEAFRVQGYEPIKLPGAEATARAGEIVLRRDRVTYLVDCRHRHAGKVGVEAIQALQRAMAARGASGGFVLTDGRFSRKAVGFAGSAGIRLVDGPALHAMLGRVRTK